MAIAFDTLAYARRLREAGFSEQQAEGQAEALAAAMTDTLATKQDLHELATRQDLHELATKQDLLGMDVCKIESRIDALEKHVDLRLDEMEKRIDFRRSAQLADLERRMTVRLGGMMLAGIAAVSALVGLL